MGEDIPSHGPSDTLKPNYLCSVIPNSDASVCLTDCIVSKQSLWYSEQLWAPGNVPLRDAMDIDACGTFVQADDSRRGLFVTIRDEVLPLIYSIIQIHQHVCKQETYSCNGCVTNSWIYYMAHVVIVAEIV
jgi:hypothetical protein